jgi:AhpD family alkylhydroperoxidase
MERIMLAVTEVNGCDLCAWAHTRLALEQGLDLTEIEGILAGCQAAIPADETAAILFAQHYADTRGRPSEAAWQRLVETYGDTKARGILGAVRVIMTGNVYGMAWSAFLRRLSGRPAGQGTLLRELATIGALVVFLPVALVDALIAALSGRR